MAKRGSGRTPGWGELIFGWNKQGKPVTARFGEGRRKGETLLSDGHKPLKDFTGKKGNRRHDHYDGKGGGTRRGKYTGYGS